MRGLAAFVVGACLTLAPASGLASEPDSDQAEQSFRDGNRAFAVGDYHAAFAAYRSAWSLKQTFDIACNLGRTEVELSLYRDAAEHLDYCLRTFSVSSRGEVRDANKRFHDLFVRVRREVSALSVEARPAGAEITVDGASYGVAPLGHDIFLDPGPHRVRARLPGFEADERSVSAEPGGSLSVTLTLSVAPVVPAVVAVTGPPAGQSPAQPAPSAPPPSRIEPRTIAVVVGGGLSLVAFGVGVGFTLDANAAHEQAKSLGSSIHQSPAGGCANAGNPDCASLSSAVARQQDSRNAADIALVTGAALGAGTLVAWLLIPDLARSTQASQLRALPLWGRSFSGFALSGAY